MRNGADVSVLLNGKPVDAFAQIEWDERTVALRIGDYLRHMPLAAKSLAIRMENKVPHAEDIAHLAKDRLFVKIELPR